LIKANIKAHKQNTAKLLGGAPTYGRISTLTSPHNARALDGLAIHILINLHNFNLIEV